MVVAGAGVGVVAGAGAGAETGTVTSVFAAGLEAVFFTAGIVFALMADFEGGIFNAWYTLYPRDLFKSHAVEGTHQNEAKIILIVH